MKILIIPICLLLSSCATARIDIIEKQLIWHEAQLSVLRKQTALSMAELELAKDNLEYFIKQSEKNIQQIYKENEEHKGKIKKMSRDELDELFRQMFRGNTFTTDNTGYFIIK